MDKRDNEHFLHIFLSGVRVFRDKPFIFEKHQKMFISGLRKECAAELNHQARSLHAIGLGTDSRVAFCGLRPSRQFWTCEWATLSIKAVAVIVPASFPLSERIAVLAETRSKVAVVASFPEADAILAAQEKLPELTHIICLEGAPKAQPVKKEFVIKYEGPPTVKAKPPVAIVDFKDFQQMGKNHPDRTAEVISAIQPTDTAILFYSQNEGEMHKVLRYSHEQLQAHARVIERLLGTAHTMHETDIVLTSPSWDHAVEHITSCFLPILRDAAIQINDDAADFTCFENHPNIVVAETAYINALKLHIEEHIKKSGRLEWHMFQKAILYGKQKYEADKLSLRRRMFDYVLNATVIKKVTKMLGSKLRLIIGIDDAASYETQLFFHTFGVDLIEVPSEIFTVE